MTDWKNKSEFYNFGILPRVCIHSPIADQYSHMYKPQDVCKCGCSEWIDGEMKIVKDYMGYEFPKKNVHRCKECNEVRIAYHIGINEND